MREAQLIASPREYQLEDIAQSVEVYQGGFDRHVPPAMGRFMVERLPNATFHFLEQEGHLSILVNAFPDYVARFKTGHNVGVDMGACSVCTH